MNEPTLEQLERLLSAFRQNGGSDAELSALAQDIIHDLSPEKSKPIQDIFVKNYHPTIKKIHDFKNDPTPPTKQAAHDFWGKRYFRYPIIFLVSFLIIFSIVNWPLVLSYITPTKKVKNMITVQEKVQPEMEKSAPLDPGEVVPTNSEVVIPKIGVTAPINFINSNTESDIHESLRTGVVHYYGTAKPGEVGNAFITGHSSNYWWERGSYNYVFANLNKMAVGDQAKVYYNGNKYVYQIKKILTVEPTDVSVLAPTPTPTLTLMTCTPPGTNWKRLIVQFDQIAPAYQAPKVIEKQIEAPEAKALPQTDSNRFLDWLAKLFNF